MHKNLCTVLIENTNENYLLSTPQRPLCFKNLKTTTNTFLIPNTVVLNPYSHSAALILNLLHLYLKFQVHLIDLSQLDIQILYGLQIDNDIWQYLVRTSSWSIGQYFRFSKLLLILIYQK